MKLIWLFCLFVVFNLISSARASIGVNVVQKDEVTSRMSTTASTRGEVVRESKTRAANVCAKANARLPLSSELKMYKRLRKDVYHQNYSYWTLESASTAGETRAFFCVQEESEVLQMVAQESVRQRAEESQPKKMDVSRKPLAGGKFEAPKLFAADQPWTGPTFQWQAAQFCTSKSKTLPDILTLAKVYTQENPNKRLVPSGHPELSVDKDFMYRLRVNNYQVESSNQLEREIIQNIKNGYIPIFQASEKGELKVRSYYGPQNVERGVAFGSQVSKRPRSSTPIWSSTLDPASTSYGEQFYLFYDGEILSWVDTDESIFALCL